MSPRVSWPTCFYKLLKRALFSLCQPLIVTSNRIKLNKIVCPLFLHFTTAVIITLMPRVSRNDIKIRWGLTCQMRKTSNICKGWPIMSLWTAINNRRQASFNRSKSTSLIRNLKILLPTCNNISVRIFKCRFRRLKPLNRTTKQTTNIPCNSCKLFNSRVVIRRVRLSHKACS